MAPGIVLYTSFLNHRLPPWLWMIVYGTVKVVMSEVRSVPWRRQWPWWMVKAATIEHLLCVSQSRDQSVLLLKGVGFFATPWTAAHQASLSITNSQSLLTLMSIESVMPSNHLILCCPLLPLPSIFPSIRVFSNESVLPIRWPKYWNFSFSIRSSNEYSGLIYFGMDWLDLLAVQGLSRVFSNTTVQKHQFFSTQLYL